MKPLQTILVIILIIPFLEIYLLLEVGSIIGAIPTIFLVASTAIIGTWLLKEQGFSTFQRLQENLRQGILPAYEMIEGPIILAGGLLLLTPGFITDILGLACLIPSLRKKIAQYIIENSLIQQSGSFTKEPSSNVNVLEGEFEKED